MAKDEGKAGKADTRAGIATETRHVYGPRPLSALIPALTRPAFRRRSPAAAQIMADWPAIVGPVLAEATVPRRLSAGTLTLGCSGPIALELQHMAAELIARINAHAGAQTVKALRFEQMLPPASPLPAPKPPSPKVRQAAEEAVAHLPAGELRDALAALGRAVLGARETGRNKPSTADRSRR